MNRKLVLVLGVLMVASVAFAQNPGGQGPTLLNGGLTGTPGGFTGSGPNNNGGPGLGRHDLVELVGGVATNYLGCETCHLPHTAPKYGNSFLWAWTYIPTNLPTYETPNNSGGALVTPPIYTAVAGVPTGNTRSMLCFSCHDGTSAGNNNIIGANTYNGAPYALLSTSGGTSYGLQTEHPVDAVIPNTSLDYVQPTKIGVNGCQAVFSSIACIGVDQLPLWIQGTSPTGSAPGVECGTCHDVHNDYPNLNPAQGQGGQPFLRVGNLYGTYLCRECHQAQ